MTEEQQCAIRNVRFDLAVGRRDAQLFAPGLLVEERQFVDALRAMRGLRTLQVTLMYADARVETEAARESLRRDLSVALERLKGWVTHGKAEGCECKIRVVDLLDSMDQGE